MSEHEAKLANTIKVVNASILDEDMHNVMVIFKWMINSDLLIGDFNQFLYSDDKVEGDDILTIDSTRHDLEVMRKNLSYVHEVLFGGALDA